MKNLLGLITLICLGWNSGFTQTRYDKYFSHCEILQLNDSVLKVNTGCIGVTIRDMDGDGKDDLVIGEFGEIRCPGQEKAKKPYVQGRCRVYKNYGTSTRPVYKDFKWLEEDGQPLYVPITCCVPMTPSFADMDGDGVPELFSGCYDGEIYTWKQDENGEFTDKKIILLADGSPLNIGHAATVFPGDVDGDGLIDLLITSLYDGVFWAKNTGTKEVYCFEEAEPVVCGAEGKKIEANHAVWYDWDGDGRLDIVYGAHFGGNVYWCRGTEKGYTEPELLIERPDNVQPGVELGQGHGDKPKLCIYDYDGDGKDDLVLATEVWESTGNEIGPDFFEKLMNDERLMEPRKMEKELRRKMAKYTDNLPRDKNSVPDARIPKKLYEKWLEATNEFDDRLQRIMAEVGGTSENVGIIWVYYRK
ncbi:MAG TPA: VCBS repeat-containing protein [Candidatus Butyricimonas faecavium]|nr:VCBS repeat-containing protein [Candidatus Butyricimonas faecavium]